MSVKRLNDDEEIDQGYYHLGNAQNGDSEMTVVARTKIVWMRLPKV